MTYNAAHHQRAIQTLYLNLKGALISCRFRYTKCICTDLLVVLQNSVDVSQLRVVRQKVNLMQVVLHFFPAENQLT